MADASATLTVTVDRARLSGTLSRRLTAGEAVGVSCRCSQGSFPAATYTLALCVAGDTVASAALSRAGTLTGTLDLSADAVADAWAPESGYESGDYGPREAMLYLADSTPRVWLAQDTRLYYLPTEAF